MIQSFQPYLDAEDPECVYLPTHGEIETLCAEIRSHWSDREYEKRSHLKRERWTAPEVDISLESNHLADE